MFDGEDGVLGVIGSIPPPPNTASSVDAKSWTFWSHLTTTLSPSPPLNLWKTSDGPVHVLTWAGGPCRRCWISVLHGVVCYQLFSWWLWPPAALRLLTRSSRVVLGWFLTVLMIIETPRCEILHGEFFFLTVLWHLNLPWNSFET